MFFKKSALSLKFFFLFFFFFTNGIDYTQINSKSLVGKILSVGLIRKLANLPIFNSIKR